MRIILLGIAVVVIVVGLFAPTLLQRGLLLVHPLYRGASWLGSTLSAPISFVQTIGSLRDQLADVHRENAKLRDRLTELEQLRYDNTLLRQQLNAPYRKQGQRHLLVHSIGKDPSGKQGSIIIDAGSRDGVKQGDPVIAPGGTLMGNVAVVQHTTALVQLLSHPKSRVDIRILPANVRGIVRVHGGVLTIDLLPQQSEITTTMIALTTGADLVYPAGFFVGDVGTVLSEETDTFQRRHLTSNPLPGIPTDMFVVQ